MTRILAVHPGPDWSVADVHTGWVEAFRRLGCTVYDFDFGERVQWHKWAHHPHLPVGGEMVYAPSFTDGKQYTYAASKHIEAAAYEFWPDLVWITYGAVVPPATMQILRARHAVVIHHTESPYEDDRQIALAAHGCADVHLINDPTNLERWRQATDAQVWYQPHAFRPGIHHPNGRREKRDVVWGGSMWPERFDWWQRFADTAPDLDLALFGNWLICQAETHPLVDKLVHPVDEICPNWRVADMYRQGRVGVNMYRKAAQREDLVDGWAMGPREVEMAACGLPFATEPRGENQCVLPFLPTFSTPEEAAERCRWLLEDDDRRLRLAGRAQAAVADRTFDVQARTVLARLEKATSLSDV